MQLRDFPNLVRLMFKPWRDAFVYSGRSTRSEVFAFYLLAMLAGIFDFELAGLDPRWIDAGWGALWAVPWLALYVRRLHDQGRSGWWALVLFAVMALATLGTGLVPQSQDLSPSFTFFFWEFHPAPSVAATVLMIVFSASFLASFAFWLWNDTPGENRYGPNPRDADPSASSASVA